MGAYIPSLSREDFCRRVTATLPRDRSLPKGCLDLLWQHFVLLRRWNRTVSLIGPGTVGEVCERHYGESLQALQWLWSVSAPGAVSKVTPGEGVGNQEVSSFAEAQVETTASQEPLQILDVGSGGGFPAYVLLALLRTWNDDPDLVSKLHPEFRHREMMAYWVEPRNRKWAFLQQAARQASLPCQSLDARVSIPLSDRLPKRFDLLTFRAIRLPSEVYAALVERTSTKGRWWVWQSTEGETEIPGMKPTRQLPLLGSDHRYLIEWRRRS